MSQQPIKFGAARLSLTVIVHFADRRIQDLSNRIKALEDALVQAGLMNDDSQIDELIVKRGEIIKGGMIKIKVVAIE